MLVTLAKLGKQGEALTLCVGQAISVISMISIKIGADNLGESKFYLHDRLS